MMKERRVVIFGGNVLAIVGVALLIEATGGLPSQLAHLYYLPVVLAALFLPVRYSIVVAVLAGLAVSPASDLVRHLTGSDIYYENVAPWNFGPEGWIVRPLAFLGISVLGGNVIREREEKTAAREVSGFRATELTILNRIDKVILAGSSEFQAIKEITSHIASLTGALGAGIILPDHERRMARAVYVQRGLASDEAQEIEIPLSGGVASWAILANAVATTSNVYTDERFAETRDFAQRIGYTAAAAAPMTVDGDVIGSVMIAYEHEREFDGDDLAQLSRLTDQAAVAISHARQIHRLKNLGYEVAIGLAEAVEGRDPYTADHCSRLAAYAVRLAKVYGLNNRDLEVVRIGAALHDIGKVVVPDAILKKPSKLTPDEFAVVKQHCYQGGQICKRISALREAYPIVYHHHERWDGRGYPDGLKGDRIPFAARIVSVVDAFDAMTSDRPYRTAMEDREAREILRDGAGSQWDPVAVENFLGIEWQHDAEHRYLRPAV